jgi:methylthioribulose-1-phosphate dehydratase
MPNSPEPSTAVPTEIADEIVAAGQRVAAKGWVPATSGNLSRRIDVATLAITVTGVDKGALTPAHVMSAPIHGAPPKGVSAETGLHQLAYRRHGETGAVVHVHSLGATLVSRRFAGSGEVIFEGYEILKAFAGVATHEIALGIPIVANSQDIRTLAEKVERRLEHYPRSPGFLIAGHGLYAWGDTMADALRHAEAFDFLFSCQLVPGGYAL